MASSTVTLDKMYFETLLRKAQFHADDVEYSTPTHLPTVTIPKSDHNTLLIAARQYANLRRNLYRGGIADETLAVLIMDDTQADDKQDTTVVVDETSNGGAHLSQEVPSVAKNRTSAEAGGHDYTYGRNNSYIRYDGQRNTNTNGHDHMYAVDDSATSPDGFFDEENRVNDSRARSHRPQFEKLCKRSVLIYHLPEATTHADVVEAVRGGMLLDIYLRTYDRTCSVSFLQEAAAHDFFRHAKRHDLCIRGKRVDVRWSEKQFILPSHVANKITIGATRNLVIQGRGPKYSEEMIRDDLEHIHNLVVIRVTFDSANAYISTNSVHNAMFARTCMMSRGAYKGSKIGWGNDECTAPLERHFQPRKEATSPKKANPPSMNRFQLLNMDDGNDDDDSDVQPESFNTTSVPA